MNEQKKYRCQMCQGTRDRVIPHQDPPTDQAKPAIKDFKIQGELMGQLVTYADGREEWHVNTELLGRIKTNWGFVKCGFCTVSLPDGYIETDGDAAIAMWALDALIMNMRNAKNCDERDEFPAAMCRLRQAVKDAACKYGLRALLPSYECRGPGGVIVQDGWRLIVGRGYFETTGDEKDVLAERRVKPFSLEECDNLIKELTAWVEEQAQKITKN